MFISHLIDHIRAYLADIFLHGKESCIPKETKEKEPWTNPYLQYSRQVIEQILAMRNLDYRTFRPILIDTDSPNQVFGEEDDVDQVLSQMEEGLNFLEICTDRPDYFTSWKEYMETEYGLIIRILPKRSGEMLYGNMVLDFERTTPVRMNDFPDEKIYLPFQKIKWEAADEPAITICSTQDKGLNDHGENENCRGGSEDMNFLREINENSSGTCLDIKVPIGYNRLIVRVYQMESALPSDIRSARMCKDSDWKSVS